MKDKIKEFNDNKKLKAALFFGFYFFFFLFIAIYVRKNNITINSSVDDNKEEVVVEEIKTYSISNLIDNDYSYEFIINDNNDDIYNLNNAENKDEYQYKYFLDIYNVNQIIKNSKHIETKDLVLSYETSNFLLSALIDKTILEGVSTFNVTVDNKGNLIKVVMDLSSLMEKDKYIITLNYKVGDANEQNSIS